MYRDEADLELLAELAGVLDATVTGAGLSPGQYLILRRLAVDPGPHQVTALAAALGADPQEVAELTGALVRSDLAAASGAGVAATAVGVARARDVEDTANTAMRDYVMQRPHTATVYGLVASMQAGRFTVEDLIAFLAEGASPDEEGGG